MNKSEHNFLPFVSNRLASSVENEFYSLSLHLKTPSSSMPEGWVHSDVLRDTINWYLHFDNINLSRYKIRKIIITLQMVIWLLLLEPMFSYSEESYWPGNRHKLLPTLA